MLGRLLTLAVLLAMGCKAHAEAPDHEPAQWLKKMAEARQTVDYRGAFTYEHRNVMESFRVFHWVEDGQVHEHLEALDGPEDAARSLTDPSGCHTVGYRLLSTSSPEQVGRIERFYQLKLRGASRVAGRNVQMLEVRPRDELRYGYLLALDKETGLLLKSLLIDEHQRLLERFQFVELSFDPDVSTLRAQARSGDKVECLAEEGAQPSHWQLEWLPPGFEFSGQTHLKPGLDMLMYTDGLASFSVFLEPLDAGPSVEGRAQRGAISAYMGQLLVNEQPYRVTVVGEVPGIVAERLARSLQVGVEAPDELQEQARQ
ncbi:MucB/RseB C-terminal domain-containing protein [Marinimicrobium sp. ARAG 43.8]|uniref:MucB/RseB C-terminal domain-containing protein n=1 Tax=Marinimicrobium sp. ARAG 43.8 TaxID=3418719 RepID=UPI003CF8757B